MKIGVTGANGFIGRCLVKRLISENHEITALVRNKSAYAPNDNLKVVKIPNLNGDTNLEVLKSTLSNLNVLIHLAGHVHVMKNVVNDPVFHNVNVLGSLRLFEAATAVGVKRFIFLSSVKAAGEKSGLLPLTVQNNPGPKDAYGCSKRDAELALKKKAQSDDCKLIILRSTFVYGWPPVGNFKSVINAIKKRIPLPFAAIENRRHMIFVGNLVDALYRVCCIKALTDQPYFVADKTPISTPEFFRLVGDAFLAPVRLFYVPVWILRLVGQATGQRAMISRLTENLEVDTAPFCRDANWIPPYNMAKGLSMSTPAHNLVTKYED